MNRQSILQKFESGTINASDVGHRGHVQVAWEMLRSYPFLEATSRYSDGIQRIAKAAGAPEKFNLTVTLSFMSIIAEKMVDSDAADFEHFYALNPELDRNLLTDWYSPQRLGSELARNVFLMPDQGNPGPPPG